MKNIWFAFLIFSLIIFSGCTSTTESESEQVKFFPSQSEENQEPELNNEQNEQETESEDIEEKTKVIEKEPIIKEEIKQQEPEKQEPSCPQFREIKKSMDGDKIDMLWYSWPDGETPSVDGWKIGGGFENWQGKFVGCYKGSKVAQNVNYYYCGEDSISPLTAHKNILDSSGTIKEKFKMNIIIVLDSEGEVVETICK